MPDICRLDSDDCLSLDFISKAFHCGIKEEHSWALIYQSIVGLKEYLTQTDGKPLFRDPNNLFIKSNGTIHPKTWTNDCSTEVTTTVTLSQVVSFIAKSVYNGLDYGTPEDEELDIPPLLEEILWQMTDPDSKKTPFEIDEGIEDFDDFSSKSLLGSVINKCESRVSDGMNIADHYKNVCRALVAEAIEVSTFLNQISKGTQELKKIRNIDNEEVESLQVEVWAHLWMKVMRQLRHGVSLKTVDRKEFLNRQQKEYELTPFEMLLDDINSKRYSLKKVSIPKKVEKDAQTLILDFIRSRPPLKPAAERILSPAPKPKPCLHDKLMEGIKKSHNLKPTPKPFERKYDSLHLPRGKRFSIYTKTVFIDSPSKAPTDDTVFQRFSFRNLSLRSTVLNHNLTAKPVPPVETMASPNSPTSTTPMSRTSFWRKLFGW